ncbi:MtnX-like HAD-IB family phosphatase [soil metagenome]
MNKVKLKIFCDFDGTITKNDVWINSLGKFIKDREAWKAICEDFENYRLSARECNLREAALLEDYSDEKLFEYLKDEEIDEYFKDFVKFCRENEYELFIVSDGVDKYINRILEKEELSLNVFCNRLVENEIDGRKVLSCEFPYGDEHCTWCGNCKRNVMLSNTNELEGEISVYIGDGISDMCPSRYADIVFAKKRLASYCWKNNITYFEYNNFFDIRKKLVTLAQKRKLKQRQEAKVRRKDVFMGG